MIASGAAFGTRRASVAGRCRPTRRLLRRGRQVAKKEAAVAAVAAAVAVAWEGSVAAAWVQVRLVLAWVGSAPPVLLAVRALPLGKELDQRASVLRACAKAKAKAKANTELVPTIRANNCKGAPSSNRGGCPSTTRCNTWL
mmetsp:Transcript_33754/g.60644  ORF Transcript_33754/g.60644 Transcript_33754/m.60644 type:complete len:141 (+) Transcript_33754:1637-2059(+)